MHDVDRSDAITISCSFLVPTASLVDGISKVTGVQLHYPTQTDAYYGASSVFLVGLLDDILRAREILIVSSFGDYS